MISIFLGGGVNQLRMIEDMGEGGVKKQGKSGDVLYGRPLRGHSITTWTKRGYVESPRLVTEVM